MAPSQHPPVCGGSLFGGHAFFQDVGVGVVRAAAALRGCGSGHVPRYGAERPWVNEDGGHGALFHA